MAGSPPIKVGLLKPSEYEEADRIFRLAFGTYIGLPIPADFMKNRDFIVSRSRAPHVKALAARENGLLIGTNLLTRWGSFGFFGPLTILPEYWGRGVAQRLLDETVKEFDRQGLKHTGLFTFAQSVKHVGLYQKFGYWPGYLTALMTHTPRASLTPPAGNAAQAVHLTTLGRKQRDEAISACARLTNRIDRGLDLSDEIRTLLRQKTGEVILLYTRNSLDSFAICLHGPDSEGGPQVCYIKFAAARSGPGAGERFDRLLDACDEFAASRGISIEAGMNMAREDAYRRMRTHGYKPFGQGVSMHKPHAPGYDRGDVYIIDDWR